MIKKQHNFFDLFRYQRRFNIGFMLVRFLLENAFHSVNGTIFVRYDKKGKYHELIQL